MAQKKIEETNIVTEDLNYPVWEKKGNLLKAERKQVGYVWKENILEKRWNIAPRKISTGMTDQEAEQEVDMKYLTVYFLYRAKQGQGVG